MLVTTVAGVFTAFVMMQSCNAGTHYTETAVGYGKSVLLELCQFVGVKYIRNPDNPECSYIACWDSTPYNMPCPPGLMVHPLFFWGGNYPCIETDTNNKCVYIHDFMLGRMSRKTQLRSKQGPLDGSSEPITSRDKMAAKTSNGNLHESVYGGSELYKPETPGRNIQNKPGADYYQPAPSYQSYRFGQHQKNAMQSKPIPFGRGIPYFQPYGNFRQRVRSTQAYPQPLRSTEPTDYNNGVKSYPQSSSTSSHSRGGLTTKETLSTVKVTTGSKPEATLELADSAALENVTTVDAPTVEINEEA